jgi:hypothetical protein
VILCVPHKVGVMYVRVQRHDLLLTTDAPPYIDHASLLNLGFEHPPLLQLLRHQHLPPPLSVSSSCSPLPLPPPSPAPYTQNTIEHFRRMETQWNLEKASLEQAEASVRAQLAQTEEDLGFQLQV